MNRDELIEETKMLLAAHQSKVVYYECLLDTLIHDDEGNLRDPIQAAKELDVEQFEFSSRVVNTLNRMGIKTFGEMVKVSEREWRHQPNFGPRSVNEIRDVISRYGYRMRTV